MISRAVAVAMLLSGGLMDHAAARTAITVVPSGPPVDVVSRYCASLCAPQYKIWNGRFACGVRTCACGCVRPNVSWPPPRFYQLY